LHRQGLVHRDIKPSNIIFVRGVPKLADVGLVAAVTDARSFVGTEGFIPPEVRARHKPTSTAWDSSVRAEHRQEPSGFPRTPADYRAETTTHNGWNWMPSFTRHARQTCGNASIRGGDAGRSRSVATRPVGQDKRASQYRWRMARKLGLATLALVLLLMPLRFLRRSTHGYTPNPRPFASTRAANGITIN